MYESEDVLRIAKRNHNKKRQYLLVNPLQGKHVPVNPADCLNMMHEFGNQLYTEFPDIGLIIGFAETATAIGAVIAAMKNANYITTTREEIGSNTIEFKEEHSHAVEQQISTENLDKLFESNTIVLIDDELSTGKTVLNIIAALKEEYPILNNKKIIAASLINRMSDEDLVRFNKAGIECRWLVKIENDSYDFVNELEASDPEEVPEYKRDRGPVLFYSSIDDDVRTGVLSKDYKHSIKNENQKIIDKLHIRRTDKILVLGTEEYMYPAILFAKQLSKLSNEVKMHATTRSPISISKEKDYPIRNGYKLHSFYDTDRTTYLYNVDFYDKVFVVTDSKNLDATLLAIKDIQNIFGSYNQCENVCLIRH